MIVPTKIVSLLLYFVKAACFPHLFTSCPKLLFCSNTSTRLQDSPLIASLPSVIAFVRPVQPFPMTLNVFTRNIPDKRVQQNSRTKPPHIGCR